MRDDLGCDIQTIEHMSQQCRLVLAGLPPEVQGAVLGEVVATWIAGHVITDEPGATDRLRKRLTVEHCKLVTDLVIVALSGRRPL
jgi:hypothetical protein